MLLLSQVYNKYVHESRYGGPLFSILDQTLIDEVDELRRPPRRKRGRGSLNNRSFNLARWNGHVGVSAFRQLNDTDSERPHIALQTAPLFEDFGGHVHQRATDDVAL